MSATKGPSNKYGSLDRTKINYEYAKSFYEKDLPRHFLSHKSKLYVSNEEEYQKKAYDFANKIDYDNNDSFVDDRKTTFKYSYSTHEFIIVDSKGMVVTYFKVSSKNPNKYWERTKRKNGK